jgi:hypothetical protein
MSYRALLLILVLAALVTLLLFPGAAAAWPGGLPLP